MAKAGTWVLLENTAWTEFHSPLRLLHAGGTDLVHPVYQPLCVSRVAAHRVDDTASEHKGHWHDGTCTP